MPARSDSDAATVVALNAQRKALMAAITALGDLRQGSLVERYKRCGKPTCHCAAEGAQGHGPSWSLTRAVAGKTITTVIPPTAVEETRLQIAEYQRLKELVAELLEVSGRLCDARRGRVGPTKTEPPHAARAGTSKRAAQPKSSRPPTSSSRKPKRG